MPCITVEVCDVHRVLPLLGTALRDWKLAYPHIAHIGVPRQASRRVFIVTRTTVDIELINEIYAAGGEPLPISDADFRRISLAHVDLLHRVVSATLGEGELLVVVEPEKKRASDGGGGGGGDEVVVLCMGIRCASLERRQLLVQETLDVLRRCDPECAYAFVERTNVDHSREWDSLPPFALMDALIDSSNESTGDAAAPVARSAATFSIVGGGGVEGGDGGSNAEEPLRSFSVTAPAASGSQTAALNPNAKQWDPNPSAKAFLPPSSSSSSTTQHQHQTVHGFSAAATAQNSPPVIPAAKSNPPLTPSNAYPADVLESMAQRFLHKIQQYGGGIAGPGPAGVSSSSPSGGGTASSSSVLSHIAPGATSLSPSAFPQPLPMQGAVPLLSGAAAPNTNRRKQTMSPAAGVPGANSSPHPIVAAAQQQAAMAHQIFSIMQLGQGGQHFTAQQWPAGTHLVQTAGPHTTLVPIIAMPTAPGTTAPAAVVPVSRSAPLTAAAAPSLPPSASSAASATGSSLLPRPTLPPLAPSGTGSGAIGSASATGSGSTLPWESLSVSEQQRLVAAASAAKSGEANPADGDTDDPDYSQDIARILSGGESSEWSCGVVSGGTARVSTTPPATGMPADEPTSIGIPGDAAAPAVLRGGDDALPLSPAKLPLGSTALMSTAVLPAPNSEIAARTNAEPPMARSYVPPPPPRPSHVRHLALHDVRSARQQVKLPDPFRLERQKVRGEELEQPQASRGMAVHDDEDDRPMELAVDTDEWRKFIRRSSRLRPLPDLDVIVDEAVERLYEAAGFLFSVPISRELADYWSKNMSVLERQRLSLSLLHLVGFGGCGPEGSKEDRRCEVLGVVKCSLSECAFSVCIRGRSTRVLREALSSLSGTQSKKILLGVRTLDDVPDTALSSFLSRDCATFNIFVASSSSGSDSNTLTVIGDTWNLERAAEREVLESMFASR